MTNTCGSCTHLIPASRYEDQTRAFGAPVPAPMCEVLGIPMSSSNMSVPGKELASAEIGCLHHSRLSPRPGRPGRHRFAADVRPGLAKSAVRPGSCTGCAFYITPPRMREAYGLPLAGCAAQGLLVPPGQGAALASGCDVGFEGRADAPLPPADQLTWPYRGNITVLTPGQELPRVPSQPEPTTVETDAEVSADDVALGIRAWRRIYDPENPASASVLMPVFDPAHFDDIERAKIPQTGDDEHPELYRDHQGLLYKVIVLWRHLGETPALNGFPGVGKTELFRYAAWSMQLPFERFSITNSTELDDLQGRVVFEEGETRWQNGRVPTAWAKPCVIVIDEPNVGPPDVWQFLRPLTDDSKQLVLDANKGERIDRNAHCYMGMAFNPAWDMRNVGTHEISDADGSRLMHIAVQPPDEEMEREIVTARCALDGYAIEPRLLTQIMGVAKDVRALAAEDGFPMHWGVRQQIKVARATRWFSASQAYRLAAGDLLDPETTDQLMVIVKSHTPPPAPVPVPAKKN